MNNPKRHLRPRRRLLLLLSFCVAAGLFLPARARGQSPPTSVVLKVDGAVEKPLALTLPDLKALSHQILTVTNQHTHQEETYEGVPLMDLLKQAGLPAGENLRGAAMTTYVLAEASDGYRVVFSLAELDPSIGGADVLVAFSLSGKPLDDRLGPLRLIVPRDKRPARWVRMLTAIHVFTVPKPT
ncbi:MAG TPA: molybdopterin-dependent oxidoreductase [Candidatus Acidoferrum sp.]|nr:molybdopterin-dependent oxidoreductase [Candidatus Acidoferrum sp.]